MMNEVYINQVKLLLDVLPEVAKEKCFAMCGGTAINLFMRDMPRLSVDIDLTYVEIADRDNTITEINAALGRIKGRIESLRPSIHVEHKDEVCKLQLDERGVAIKIEVNMIGRGLLGDVIKAQLSEVAQQKYDVFCVMPIVPMGQLYGGKLCAALDRQHPRDLFDVKLMFEEEGFTNEIKRGLIYGLAGSNRPTHELLSPNLLNQQTAFTNQFEGMSAIEFSYDDFVATRTKLIESVSECLSEDDKAFLLGLNRLQPDWSIYDLQDFPSVQWKLKNLEKFKKDNPGMYQQQLDQLEAIMGSPR